MNLLLRPGSRVWLLLMLATIATTWWLSKDGLPTRFATVAIFVIAGIKVRLVLLHFMELRTAPRVPRLIFEAWVLVISAAIIAVYLQTPLAGEPGAAGIAPAQVMDNAGEKP